MTTPAAAPAIGAPLAYLGEAVAAAAVVQTAGRLGVLARLDGAPARTAELTDACEISERGARLLLGALAGLGLAEAVGGGAWRAALPDLAGLAGTAGMWAHLAEALREDRPLLRGDTPEGAAAFYPGAVSHLGAMLSAVAERAAKLLPPAGRVLDAGAGAAPWSLAVAARDPACLVTAVDLPAVVPATRRAVRSAGRERQFRFLAGDLYDVDLGRGVYDLAIAGNLCHLFNGDANRRLLGRLYDALAPGGRLAVMDVIPDEEPRPRWVALYELGLFLRTASGRVHPLAAYLDWLHDAGFEPPEQHHLVDQAQAVLLLARRPAGG
ncbi:MAG TPA: methyltransferase [Actinomycetota bacterium]|nr:methyltransferase [Actinomycetota bacterium]